ncbi:D-2-hydroxyacid dehydrogenase [Pedobacter immunditicola]|uniref:D-2-hydroxyacid dehydrogenase n=1 Tax=Pedobacter immunditicola TaxID=3133440 RepID=UPI0030AFA2B4
MNILVYTNFNEAQRIRLNKALPEGSVLLFKADLTAPELIPAFENAEIILGNPPATDFNRGSSKLLFWHIDSAGIDQYQQLNLNVPVANMGAFFAQSCAETIVSGILCFYRQIHQLVRLQAEKKWEGKQIRTVLQGLTNKNVLILGAGAIASAVKKMLSGFDCQVMTVARKNPSADLHDFNKVLEVLPEIDLVINTLPGTADNYVSTAFFNVLKPGSLYANVGRGNTTDETALIHALEIGKLAGAVLDVTEVEPLPANNVLWEMPNVILTQHSGGGDENETEGKLDQFIANIQHFMKGNKIQDLVDLKRGY